MADRSSRSGGGSFRRFFSRRRHSSSTSTPSLSFTTTAGRSSMIVHRQKQRREEQTRRCIDAWPVADLQILRDLVYFAVHKAHLPRRSSTSGSSSITHRPGFRQNIDVRLQVKKRSHFTRLFPLLTPMSRATVKRIYEVFDRSDCGRITFSEICETLTWCRVGAWRLNIEVLFLWFHDRSCKLEGSRRVGAITSSGANLLAATARELVGRNPALVQQLTSNLNTLKDEIMQGQTAITYEEFRDRLVRRKDVICVLLAPFDIVRPVIQEDRILDDYHGIRWNADDTAYIVAMEWWKQWLRYLHIDDLSIKFDDIDDTYASMKPKRITLSRTTENNQHEKRDDREQVSSSKTTQRLSLKPRIRPGPIDNRSLCASEHLGTLKCDLRSGVDYVLVTASIWQQLMHIYGGGPEFPRQILAVQNASHESATAEGQAIGTKSSSRTQHNDRSSKVVQYTHLQDVEVDLYPLCLQVRVAKHDSKRSRLLFARRFLIRPSVTLKQLFHRIGIIPGENSCEIVLWVRRHKLSPWKHLECSLDAPRSSFRDLSFKSSYELLIDFRPLDKERVTSRDMERERARKSSMQSDPFAVSVYRPVGNDFVCTEKGLAHFFKTGNWNPLASSYSVNNRAPDSVSDGVLPSHAGTVMNTNGIMVDVSQHYVVKSTNTNRLATYEGIRATGLLNMGNTCFMNCALQCIGHSPIFREYFLSQRYLDDINKKNHLGTKGKIAVAYARLTESLWKEREVSYHVPMLFRDEFTRVRRHFQETRQHDTHEFIVSLLDGLHEDLNRSRAGQLDDHRTSSGCLSYLGDGDYEDDLNNKRHSATDNSSSDETIGSLSWQTHASMNSSVVVDLFHGQMRGETICKTCSERKVMFDPFLFFSVPIPEAKFVRLEVKVVLQVRFQNDFEICSTPAIRTAFWMRRGSNAGSLCDRIGAAHGLQGNRFILVEVRKSRINRVVEGDELVENVAAVRELHAYERAWMISEIPIIPRHLQSSDNGVSFDINILHPKRFIDIRVGARVDALSFEGDWFPGTVIDMIDAQVYKDQGHRDVESDGQQRVCVHFDGFSSKWNRWFDEADWEERRIQPVHTKTKHLIEVFEVQLVHRYVTQYAPSSKSSTRRRNDGNSRRPCESSREKLSFEVFGLPLFVTIASDKTSRDLHESILLQASRFIRDFNIDLFTSSHASNEYFYSNQHSNNDKHERDIDIDSLSDDQLSPEKSTRQLPYKVHIVNLEDVGGALGEELPYDSSGILQHFSSRSVLVLDWSHNIYLGDERVDPDDIPADMDEVPDASMSSSMSSIPLAKCIDGLLKHETISLDDHWICEHCGVAREGARRSDIWKLPDLVMIQLKRFQYLENQHRQKVRAFVDFPLLGLDFSKWMGSDMHRFSSSDEDSLPVVSAVASGSPMPLGMSSSSPEHIYDLYAVANHVGSLTRGHYTAYCRYDRDFPESAKIFTNQAGGAIQVNDLWFRFDDDKVVEIASGDVVSDAAYVLFYKRRTLSSHNVLQHTL